MTSTPQPKRSKRSWTDEDMNVAYAAVTEDGMSTAAAAAHFKVPRMTLSDRVTGKVKLGARTGRPPVLGAQNEEALLRYAKYMAEHRYPVTRTQIMGLGWAIALRQGINCFGESGPSLHWWRGFRDRNPGLSFRRPEAVDRGRVSNATPEIIADYFDTLEALMKSHNLLTKPNQIYNCDEVAIFLNRSSQKVLMPVKSKHCHTLVQGTNQHISVLCCVSAGGKHLPDLVIFSKGMPAGRNYANDGPTNATYTATDSGFVNKDIYLQWFKQNFLKHATDERPLLLLQDGAAAHISPELIDLAIANDVILLCFPPKLTHILQPCDVAIFRKMKADLSAVMNQIRMLRTDCWISKSKFPAVLKEVESRTFKEELVQEAFRKCGIFPVNRSAIEKQLLTTGEKMPSTPGNSEISVKMNVDSCAQSESSEDRASNLPAVAEDGNEEVELPIQDGEANKSITDVLGDSMSETDTPEETKIIDLVVEKASVVPEAAEVLVSAHSEEPLPCPPQLALAAIEHTLTPKKRKSYLQNYDAEVENQNDSVYTTWRILKKKIEYPDQTITATTSVTPIQPENPLVTAGIIPSSLGDILTPPKRPAKHTMSIGRRRTTRARVLTADEIADEIREYDQTKKAEKKAMEERKESRERKRVLDQEEKLRKEEEKVKKRKTIEEKKRCQAAAKMVHQQKRIALKHQRNLGKCKTFPSFVECCNQIRSQLTDVDLCLPRYHENNTDDVSCQLLKAMDEFMEVKPVKIPAYGNCLPATMSMYMCGDVVLEVEARVRIAVELATNADLYLDDNFLSQGMESGTTSRSTTYGMFSEKYQHGMILTSTKTRELFENEVMSIAKPNVYMGMWQVHAAASILGSRVRSVYPGKGPVASDLNRLICPRSLRYKNLIYIMWTSTHRKDRAVWWEPNHFVPLLHQTPQVVIPEVIKIGGLNIINEGSEENAEDYTHGTNEERPQHSSDDTHEERAEDNSDHNTIVVNAEYKSDDTNKQRAESHIDESKEEKAEDCSHYTNEEIPKDRGDDTHEERAEDNSDHTIKENTDQSDDTNEEKAENNIDQTNEEKAEEHNNDRAEDHSIDTNDEMAKDNNEKTNKERAEHSDDTYANSRVADSVQQIEWSLGSHVLLSFGTTLIPAVVTETSHETVSVRYYMPAKRDRLWVEGAATSYDVDADEVVRILPDPELITRGRRSYYRFNID